MANSDLSAESNATALLKDHINAKSIEMLAGLIKQHQPEFPSDEFIEQATFQLESMELKTRVNHLSEVMSRLLVDDYLLNAKWLKQLAANWPDQDPTRGWHSFMAWPLIDYAGKQGLQYPVIALDLLKHLTPLFTAEFAIRPYIEQHFDLTYRQLLLWCKDNNEHVRRLASEGIRPRLPWGGHLKALQQNPQPVLELINLLKDDHSHYVQKSVANSLNDISKDHPQRVIEVSREWLNNATPQRKWIVIHALRSLIKNGVPAVFPILGYSNNPQVRVEFALTEKYLKLGEKLSLQATIHSTTRKPQKLVMDYRVWHVKANGKTTAKVYKWKNLNLPAGESIRLTKSHGFLKMTTRQYYGGRHTIEILINGVTAAKADLELRLD